MRVHVRVAPMARTAPWSAPVTTLLTARPLMGLASAKRVKYSHRVNDSQCLTMTGAKLVKSLSISHVTNQTWLHVCLQAGEGRTVPPRALREPGAEDATPAATAPTGRNAILQMDPAPAQPAGMGHAVRNRAR